MDKKIKMSGSFNHLTLDLQISLIIFFLKSDNQFSKRKVSF